MASENESSPAELIRGGSEPWLPPGADTAEHSEYKFEESVDCNFWVPDRLVGKSEAMVSAVNDFHYAMINDLERNEFYKKSLLKYLSSDSTVLEIGTGSGLLAMIAARYGASHVTAIEANEHLCKVAHGNLEKNGLTDKVTIGRCLHLLFTHP